MKQLTILISGPYRSGTNDNPELMAQNLKKLEDAALPLFKAGHLPLIGEWIAIPLQQLAGSKKVGDDAYNTFAYPVAKRMLPVCDAVLRLPGASTGADQDVMWAREMGLQIFNDIHDIPGVSK